MLLLTTLSIAMTMNEPAKDIGQSQGQLNDRVTGYCRDIIEKMLNLARWIWHITGPYIMAWRLPAGDLYSRGQITSLTPHHYDGGCRSSSAGKSFNN